MKKIILRLFYDRERVLSAIGLTLIALLIVGGWFWTSSETLLTSPEYASAATSSAVTVSASVTAVISCSNSTSTTAFGTLTTASVFTSSPNVSSTMACANSSLGCTLSVKDAGSTANPGLWNSGSSYLIPSPDAAYNVSSTLVASTEGYGIQATTTAVGSGATFAINARYLKAGDAVGGLTTTTLTFASTTATTSGREVITTHKAAISGATAAGTYADTITYSCLAN